MIELVVITLPGDSARVLPTMWMGNAGPPVMIQETRCKFNMQILVLQAIHLQIPNHCLHILTVD
jgi:hypothetical protein